MMLLHLLLLLQHMGHMVSMSIRGTCSGLGIVVVGTVGIVGLHRALCLGRHIASSVHPSKATGTAAAVVIVGRMDY